MFFPSQILLLETTTPLPSKLEWFARSMFSLSHKIMQTRRFRFHLRHSHVKNDYA